MKTTPMEHQKDGRARLRANPKAFALAAEQGTGKTWMLLDDIEHQFKSGRITAAAVIAPKGVHTNWARREIPKHMSIPVRSGIWRASPGVKHKKQLDKLLQPAEDGELIFFAVNIDAINTKPGRDYLRAFLMAHEAMLIVDESSRIKNMTSARTKHMIDVGQYAVSRRIASGTMITGGPQDAFAQFEFLAPGKGLLGTRSYRSFVAEYAETLPPENGLVRNIAREHMRKRLSPATIAAKVAAYQLANPGASVQDATNALAERWSPQMLAKDAIGRPIYKNLDKLTRLMAPLTYRILKSECLDLPPKVYQILTYDLEPEQRRVYEKLRDEQVFERSDGDIDKFSALTKLMKLRQAVSGFVMVDGEPVGLAETHPRIELLEDLIEDVDGQFIVWATFREEIAQIARLFRRLGIPAVEYHGSVSTADREVAVDSFQEGSVRAFIGQQQSGGIGLTLTAASTAIYYSSDFSLENRLQSEDRCHRIGTTKSVRYIDLAASDTIDERIAEALQAKEEVASLILSM